jgi:uncharacterized membrane protein YfcA
VTPAQSALLLLLAGIGLAFANTLASSGSALSLPVLLAVGLGPELANGTNRVAVLAGATAATVTFVQAGRIQWRIVRPLMVLRPPGWHCTPPRHAGSTGCWCSSSSERSHSWHSPDC